MADHSKIEWTDATWNIVTGCSVLSPGCTNCYAMKLAGTRLKHHPSREGLTRDTKAGPVWTGEVRVNWEWIDQPLSWAKPRQIFVCAHGDLFHETVAWEDLATIYGVMIAAHHIRGHTLQVLTKRSARAREMLSREDFWEFANAHASALIMERVDPLDRRSDDARATCEDYGPHNPPPGIWVGVSVEDQARADERIPDLLATPAAVRWLSCEPLLGPVDLRRVRDADRCTSYGDFHLDALTGSASRAGASYIAGIDLAALASGTLKLALIDWVVAGGESGSGARPMHPDWARSLRDQCAAAGVPFHFKQWGAWAPSDQGSIVACSGNGVANCAWPDGTIGYGNATEHGGPGYFLANIGKKAAGRLLDGVEHNGVPA